MHAAQLCVAWQWSVEEHGDIGYISSSSTHLLSLPLCFSTGFRDLHSLPIMYVIGNIYLITAISVIGGGLFGFDISSMSAM